MKILKIAVWGYFGYRNCGDDLLLLNMIREIEKIVLIHMK